METKPNYTVAKLIDELKKFPPEMAVVTNGYEGEYENILPLRTITVKHVSGEPYYNGQFHIAKKTENNTFGAVAILREIRPY